MRIGLIALAIVIGLLVLGDSVARHYEESQVANSIKTSLSLSAKPRVSLHGFPFILELARGKISSATLAADRITAGSVTFSDIHVLLHHLRFSIDQLLTGKLEKIHAAGGIGDASITTASVNTFLRAHGAPFQVSFEGGRTVAKLGPLSAGVNVSMKVSNGSLLISTGSSSLPQLSIPLPPIFKNISYGAARAGTGRLILDFRLLHPTLDLQP
jgi:LmeA-like phospholipid-binding